MSFKWFSFLRVVNLERAAPLVSPHTGCLLKKELPGRAIVNALYQIRNGNMEQKQRSLLSKNVILNLSIDQGTILE